MNKIFIILTILFLSTALPSFSNENDSATNPLYEEFNQVKNPIALLILFDSAPGIAKNIPKETTIPTEAALANIQCIGINQTELFLSDTTYNRIKNTIEFCMKKYAISNGNILIGGFSLGGYTTVRFTEMAKEKGHVALIPRAIFGVDPLLDHVAAYNYALKELNRNCNNEGAEKYGKPEAWWLKNYYLTNFGTPDKDSSIYIKRSAYSVGINDGGNAKFILDIPIRIYHETDVMWYIKERCRDITDENIIVGSQLINFLYNHGNKNAILIETKDKGKRADGRRHPHSWSIADPKETIEWLKLFIK
jgi:hypothetical protein